MLILAGITISALNGDNGILTRTSEASEKTKEANAKEKVQLAVTASIGTDGNIDEDTLNTELSKVEGLTSGIPISGLPADVVVDAYTITINEDGSVTVLGTGDNTETGIAGKYYETNTKITVGGKTVAIPGGATVSGIAGEYENVDNGLVIYITNGDTIEDWNADKDSNGIKDVQKDYDQFIWVPVEKASVTEAEIEGSSFDNLKKYVTTNKIYPMAIQQDDGSYKGILYDFTEENGAVTVSPQDYTTSLSYREPAYLTSPSYGDASDYNTVGITEESLQEEFNTMIAKVDTNGGFWVGRYETTNMVNDSTKDSTNEITVIKGETTGINNVNWYRMYAQQKSYSNLALTNSGITSSMIWGSQWDQIMIWMREVKNIINTTNGQYYITNAVGMGNYGIGDKDENTSNPVTTGICENYKVKNVYDLAGNVYEWTLEANRTSSRVQRRWTLWQYR